MSNLKVILSSLLVIQLLLAGGLYLSGKKTSEFEQVRPLVNYEADALQALSIYDESADIRLQRRGATWFLASHANLPADAEKVEDVLAKLFDIQVNWPVASSSASHERFEVGEAQFQRKLVLEQVDGELTTVFMGTSPGYRNVHARLQSDNEVYAVPLATHDFPVKSQDWLDKSVLQVSDVRRIKGHDYELASGEDEQWVLVSDTIVEQNPEQAPSELDKQKVEDLVTLFTSLQVQDVATELSLENPIEVVVFEEKNTWTYQFAKQGDEYFVSRNDLVPVFKIRQADFEKVSRATRNHFATNVSTETGEDNQAENATAERISEQ